MKFCVIGDVHGNWNSMINLIEHKGITDGIIIQAGDFGVGFVEKHACKANLKQLNERLAKSNNIMYVIRGNHDDPAYFDGSYDFGNLKLVRDYTVMTVDGEDIALIGGAISIDRKPRLAEMMEYSKYGLDRASYWYDEQFVFDEKLANEIKGCLYVVTHTAPDFCWPNNKFGFGQLVEHFAMGDNKLKKDLMKERNDMTKLYNALKENNPIQKWFYGHFHSSRLTEHEGVDFHLLGINEIKEVR